MKSQLNNPIRTWRSSIGFTLIELLLVISIIAILAALTISGMSYAQQASARNKTLAFLSSIKSGLETYKEKFGEYPSPKAPAKTEVFGVRKMVSGGAAMLYQALSGDGSDDIDIGQNANSKPSDGKIDVDELPNKIIDLPKGMVYRAMNGTILLIVDGFGRPFQYQKGNATDTINASSYDLWSYGTAQENSIPTGLPSLDEKQSVAGRVKPCDAWIKNW